MRKRTRRLELHRETLRHLQLSKLAGIAGGTGNTNEIMTGCACTEGCGSNCGCGSAGCNSAGCGGSAEACGTGTTNEFISGCATNC